MANAPEQSAVAPRATRKYVFARTRDGATEEIFPGAGSTLRLASRAADTLSLRNLPPGLLQAGDTVAVKSASGGDVYFEGKVKTVVNRQRRGDDCAEDVVAAGPWDDLERIVYRQEWGTIGGEFKSSRAVLGQDPFGNRLDVVDQLADVAACAGYSLSHSGTGLSGQYLPLDEVRDMTCADVIRRLLRFFPGLTAKYRYSDGSILVSKANVPVNIGSWKILERERQYDAKPVECVAIAADPVTRLTRGASQPSSYAQVYPADGDTEGPGCLHVTIPLAPSGGGTSSETFKSVTEDFPQSLLDVAWWRQKHPRLANVAASAISITEASRSPANYPRIAKATKGEIEAAGLHCETSRVTCKCRIQTADDEEEEILLSMDFLTTDARNKTYTWQTGSWSQDSETLPAGLAQALYEQHSRTLVSERVLARDTFRGSVVGLVGTMVLDGLALQEQTVDFDAGTVLFSFGPPPSLGVEDMRRLLDGFRQRGYASTAAFQKRTTQGDAYVPPAGADGGIPPLATSEWAPGVKAKTTIKKTGAGAVRLDAAAVPQGETVAVKTLTLTGAGANGADKTLKVLATEDMTIDPSGGGSGGVTQLEFFWDPSSSNRLKVRLKKADGTVASTASLPLWKQDVAANPEYSTDTHEFTADNVPGVRTREAAPSGTDKATVFTATPHSAE